MNKYILSLSLLSTTIAYTTFGMDQYGYLSFSQSQSPDIFSYESNQFDPNLYWMQQTQPQMPAACPMPFTTQDKKLDKMLFKTKMLELEQAKLCLQMCQAYRNGSSQNISETAYNRASFYLECWSAHLNIHGLPVYCWQNPDAQQ